MWSSLKEYRRPRSVAQALRLLARERPRTRPLAGGTWLVAGRDPAVEAVVDLSALGLDHLSLSGRRMTLGAMVTLQTLASDPRIAALAGGLLAEAARRSAPRAVRNMATLGGVLAVGDPAEGVLLALVAMQAQVHVRTPAVTRVPVDAFLASRPAFRSAHGLITQVVLPVGDAKSGGGLVGVSATPRDRPIVCAAAVVVRRGERVESGRLAMGGVGPLPVRLPAVEAALEEARLDETRLEEVSQSISGAVTPEGDWRGSAGYRRAMAGVVAARALREAWGRAAEA